MPEKEITLPTHILNKSPVVQQVSKSSVHSAAQILGTRGGKRGGPARAAKLSPARRRQIALMGGKARWRKRPTQVS